MSQLRILSSVANIATRYLFPIKNSKGTRIRGDFSLFGFCPYLRAAGLIPSWQCPNFQANQLKWLIVVPRISQAWGPTMPAWSSIIRPSKEEDAREVSLWLTEVSRAVEILSRNPRPDLFLGRKTQEPFPSDRQGIDADRSNAED
jgi:hypothetical protein